MFEIDRQRIVLLYNLIHVKQYQSHNNGIVHFALIINILCYYFVNDLQQSDDGYM